MLLLLPSHVNLTGYGGGSTMAVITQMVVEVQLVIWTVMLSWCLMWRGMNFARVLQRSRMWTRHGNDRKSTLHLWHHQVQSSQDDPVLWSTEPKASSLSTEHGGICFLCEQGTTKKLTKASTLGVDAGVRSCAYKIDDKTLIGKLSEGDLIVLGAQYHPNCLGHYHSQAVASDKNSVDSSKTSVCKAQAFSDLVEYIEFQRVTHVTSNEWYGATVWVEADFSGNRQL